MPIVYEIVIKDGKFPSIVKTGTETTLERVKRITATNERIARGLSKTIILHHRCNNYFRR